MIHALKTKSRTRNSIINITTGIGGQICSTILKFVVRTVFIHTLGKSYLGINGLFTNILTMLSLTELGFDTAINFKLYKPLAENDDRRVRILLKFYQRVYGCVGLIILLLGLALIPVLPLIIKDYDTMTALGINTVLIFMLHIIKSVCSYCFFAYRSAVLKANQEKYLLDIVDFFVDISGSLAEIIGLLIFKDFVLYTSTLIGFNILRNFVSAYIVKRRYPQFFIKEQDSMARSEVLDMIKDCASLFIYKMNHVVVKSTDNIVISSFVGLGAVGIYSNYLLFYTTARTLFDKVYSAVKASMGNLFATESIEKQYRFFQFMNYLSVILFGTACCGIAVCGDELIEVWIGKDYVIGNAFAILIGVEVFFHGLRINLGQIRNVSGVFRKMWFRPVMGIIVNLGVSIAMVRICGIHGVIIGTIVSDITSNFMVDPRIIHKYSFNNYKPASEYYIRNIGYISVLAGTTALNLLFSKNVFTGHGWFSVIVHGFVAVVTVPIAFIVLYRNSQECGYLLMQSRRVLKKVLGRRIGAKV